MVNNCIHCKETKDIVLFVKNKRLKKGVENTCRICANLILKKWRKENPETAKKYELNNKEKIKKRNQAYREKNIESQRLKGTKRYKDNLEKIKSRKSELHKIKTETNPLYVKKRRIRAVIINGIKRKGYSKKSKTFEILGCEYDFFIQYIEAQFKKGMQWDNIHLDHIKPMSSAKNENEAILLNHYTNFQPLFKKDNLIKNDKLITKQLRLI